MCRSILCLVGVAALVAVGQPPPGRSADTSRDSTFAVEMKAGDGAFRAFDNQAAWSHYVHAHAIDSTAYDALWKLSRAYVHRADVAPRDEKKGLLGHAVRLGRSCVALYPDSAQAHFILAMALGKMAAVSSGRTRIAISRDVKHEADAALAIQPDHYGALHVLGRWNYELAKLNWLERSFAKIIYGGVPPGASMKAARACFEKAIALDPATPINHLWLGEALIRLGDHAGARDSFERCVALDDVLWDDRYTKDTARKRLKDIEGK